MITQAQAQVQAAAQRVTHAASAHALGATRACAERRGEDAYTARRTGSGLCEGQAAANRRVKAHCSRV
jgi:hypothetical protein